MISHLDMIDNSYCLFNVITECNLRKIFKICYNVMPHPSSCCMFYVIYKLKIKLLCYIKS